MIMELLISLVFISGILYIIDWRVNRYILMNKYKIVMDLFNYFLDKSYDTIYSDQIIGYTSSGQKIIPNDEMETIERNFIKLSLQLMGPTNEYLFQSFFGQKTVMMDNMLLFVRAKLNTDALAKIIQNHENQGK